MTRLLPRLTLCAIALGVGGCAVTTPPLVAGHTAVFVADGQSFAGPASRWWAELGDPALDSVVDAALADNPTVEAANLRLKAARASDDVTLWSLLPKSSYDLERTYAKTHENVPDRKYSATSGFEPTVSSAFTVSWELPLFGKAQALSELQRSQGSQAYWQLDAAKISVAAEVVRAYVEWRGLRVMENLIRQRQATVAELLEGQQRLQRAGAGSQAEVGAWQAQQLQLGIQQSLAGAQRQKLEMRLATLQGRPSPVGLTVSEASQALPAVPLVYSVPASALRQRPDLRAAEQSVAQAAARLGVAQANLWPQLNLGGALNMTRGTLDSLNSITGSTGALALTAGLHIPLLDWFSLKAQARVKSVELDTAVVEYRQAVLMAWEESQNAYRDYTSALEQSALSAKATELGQAEEGRQSKLLAGGAATRLDVGKAHLARLEMQAQGIAAQSTGLQAWTKLVKATFVHSERSIAP